MGIYGEQRNVVDVSMPLVWSLPIWKELNKLHFLALLDLYLPGYGYLDIFRRRTCRVKSFGVRQRKIHKYHKECERVPTAKKTSIER